MRGVVRCAAGAGRLAPRAPSRPVTGGLHGPRRAACAAQGGSDGDGAAWLSERASSRGVGGGRGDSGRGGSGRGRSGNGGRGGAAAGARSGRGRAPSGGAPGGSEDFVVIGRADDAGSSDAGGAGGGGAYIASPAELEALGDAAGGAFWEAALLLGEDGEEGEEEFGEEGEEREDCDGGEGESDDEIDAEEVASLMQELAEGLGEEEGEAGGAGGAAGWRGVYLSRQPPPLQLGPVRLKAAPGMGRGLFTTDAAAPGDLLLVAAPLALLYCKEGATPENEELAEALSAAVAASRSGSGGSGGGGSSSDDGGGGGGARARALLGDPAEVGAVLQQQQAAAGGAAQAGGAAPQPAAPPPPASLPDEAAVLQLVFANCTGEEFEDPALALLRGSTSCGHLGVWPAAAMANHSCAPNAHAMLLGDRLVVRAAEALAAGEQVFLSYLGPQLFAPAGVRRAELAAQWGFECGCARCKAEDRYGGGGLGELLQEAHDAALDLSPAVDAAVDGGDDAALRALQAQLADLQARVEAGVRAAKPPAHVRRWLQSSVYDLYDLLSLCADQLPAPPPRQQAGGGRGRGRGGGRGRGRGGPPPPAVETEALAACARIVGAATPGSSAHCDLATEYMIRCEARFSEGHQETADATRACAAAHTTRYGPLTPGLRQLLTDTRAGAALL
ncbi:hypothetical protein HT031_005320 [Scenedesmus sp. PABB004]|nr:hypothetical protein HT031_005320 [Scenedesmus sp. PABB004]